MNLNKHIWEGWTVQDFVDELEPVFNIIIQGHEAIKNEEELKEWCKDNQPYYKKHIPEVFNYFKLKLSQS